MSARGRIVNTIRANGKSVWYMFCVLMLGIIDQRRGSAPGDVQMMFSNGTGLVTALMLVPSLDWNKFRSKSYLRWTPFCIIGTIAACVMGVKYWSYAGQWVTGVLNLTVWSYLILYIIRERRYLEVCKRVRQPFFWCILVLWILMFLSRYEGILPLWYLMIFGGFYLIGIPQKLQRDFFCGMLNGIILWFFVQQMFAFGFRPYDYVRYRGMYSGETQNGLFYMIVYCAFLLKWVWAREERHHRLLIWYYFIMSAGCVSFMVFTGGRAPLFGAAVVTLVVYTWYEIIHRKNFYKWLLHGVMLVLCIVTLFPVVYGCIRYLPTILHHPIWFAGNYVEGSSVCSFDDWDSPKYITFEEALEVNVGRVLDAIGIDYRFLQGRAAIPLLGMKVYAAEAVERTEAGSSRENPFILEGTDMDSSVDIRKVIYAYYWKHLNWGGHSKSNAGFYITETSFIEHAHNMFLQMAYDYGTPAGILFLGICIYSVLQALWRRKPVNLIIVSFLLAIGCFGFAETVWVPGQITVALMWILFYFVGEDSHETKCFSETGIRH